MRNDNSALAGDDSRVGGQVSFVYQPVAGRRHRLPDGVTFWAYNEDATSVRLRVSTRHSTMPVLATAEVPLLVLELCEDDEPDWRAAGEHSQRAAVAEQSSLQPGDLLGAAGRLSGVARGPVDRSPPQRRTVGVCRSCLLRVPRVRGRVRVRPGANAAAHRGDLHGGSDPSVQLAQGQHAGNGTGLHMCRGVYQPTWPNRPAGGRNRTIFRPPVPCGPQVLGGAPSTSRCRATKSSRRDRWESIQAAACIPWQAPAWRRPS